MDQLNVDSTGRLTLRGIVVRAEPMGSPTLADQYDLADLSLVARRNQIEEANAFIRGNRTVTETIPGPYTAYSAATDRHIEMPGPRRVLYYPVQFYRIAGTANGSSPGQTKA